MKILGGKNMKSVLLGIRRNFQYACEIYFPISMGHACFLTKALKAVLPTILWMDLKGLAGSASFKIKYFRFKLFKTLN